jgi:hypothetical protein
MAWGVQAWYNCAVDGTNGGYHSDINTREEKKALETAIKAILTRATS